MLSEMNEPNAANDEYPSKEFAISLCDIVSDNGRCKDVVKKLIQFPT